MDDVHRVVTPCMQRTHSLRRSSICIDSIDTIRDLLFGGIVLTLMPRVRVIFDAATQKNVVAPTAFDNERRDAGNLGRSRRETECRTFFARVSRPAEIISVVSRSSDEGGGTI
jgi:hypothetical protein